MALPIVLTIGGFDPVSGAGITADIKTALAHKCFAVSCITAMTVQSSAGVQSVATIDAELVRRTLAEIEKDVSPVAVKVGMLGSGEVAEAVAKFLEGTPAKVIVVDPVRVSSSGAALADEEAERVLRERIIPALRIQMAGAGGQKVEGLGREQSGVVTPNAAESGWLAGMPVTNLEEAAEAARRIQKLGAGNVVVTGVGVAEVAAGGMIVDGSAHRNIDLANQTVDLVVFGNGEQVRVGGRRLAGEWHGTGCAYAMSLCCGLACGSPLLEAAKQAREYVAQAIEGAIVRGAIGRGPMGLI